MVVAMMQTTGENYYDIPDDELPSANFAARPASEISDLGLLDIDRQWTFMSFTASLSSDDTGSEVDLNNGPTPTTLTPDTPRMPQPELPQTPPDTPAIKVVSPSRRQSLRQHLRKVSDVASIVKRPSMRHKAGTAPPGAFSSSEYAPQLPRRAMSARLDKRDSTKARHSRHLSSESDLKARRVLGMSESVMEEERPWPGRRQLGNSEDSEEQGNSGFLQPHTSFSRRPRVQEALEKKKLTRLRMDFVATEPHEMVDSPQSMLGTPQELYAVPQSPLLQPGRFRPTSAIHGRRGTSTPVSPRTPSPYKGPWPQPSENPVGDNDLDGVCQTRIYVSGPICLEKHPAMLRKNSVATLDPFASEIDSIGRRSSDLLVLEQIIVYFGDMGLDATPTEACLDRYWLNTSQEALHETALDVNELAPATPRGQHGDSSKDATHSELSRFSFSSASSGASVTQDSPQKRQLIRLRRLLSPALPGLKGPEG